MIRAAATGAIEAHPPRPAVAADAPACAAILREWVADTPWFPRPDPPQTDAGSVAARIAREQAWVCGHRAVAFLVLEGSYVSCLYVTRGMRGRGLGRALLDVAKDGQQELRLWTFQRNRRARAFYQREGFHEVRRTCGAGNDEGLPDIEFCWRAEEQA